MKLDATTWSRVGELFDELASLTPRERERHLAQKEIAEPVRRWLDRLLTAHDTPDPSLLDRAVDDIVGDLLDDTTSRVPATIEGRWFGPWRAVEKIGRGGMGVVVRGERADGQFRKDVAIKLLPPGPATSARAERLGAEIRLLASLEHANIAHLLDGGLTEDGIPYLVMEYVDGVSINDYCDAHRLNLRQRVSLVVETTRAVAYSHRRLVVHCDIKPGNVMVTAEGQVKVVDFGVAARLKDAPEAEAAFPALHCSPGYAAPEQLAGRPPAVAHDIFALGALLYELITGRRIRDASSTTRALVGRVPDDEIAAPSATAAVDADLDAICLKALANDPERRYAGTEAMLRDLEAWLRHRPVEARQGGRVYRAGKWLRRHHWSAAAGGVAILSLVTGAGLALWQAGEARTAAAQAEAEAERAGAALAEAEQALGRAESLTNFLIDMFEAARPERPSDRMPGTEEILAAGAARALEMENVSASERIGMLLAIARVYISQRQDGHADEAKPLLETAVSLARQERRDGDLARAIFLQAIMARVERRLGDAEALLLDAESLVEDRPERWEIFAEIRTERGWLKVGRGEPQAVIELLQPLHEQIESGEKNPALELSNQIASHLAHARRDLGDLDKSFELRFQVLDGRKRETGVDSIRYGVELGNLAGLELRMGRLEDAIERYIQAIEIYDRVHEHPVEVRGSAREHLAIALFHSGQYEQARHEMRLAQEEWSAARGVQLDDYPNHHYWRGVLWAHQGRLDEAARALSRAHALFEQRDSPSLPGYVLLESALARVHCRRGDIVSGEEILSNLKARLPDSGLGMPDLVSELEQSIAECRFHAGDFEGVLKPIRTAIETAPPGYVVSRANHKLLHARTHFALHRLAEASETLDRAEALFYNLNLPDHPELANIQEVRQELLAGQ